MMYVLEKGKILKLKATPLDFYCDLYEHNNTDYSLIVA